jgi:hypothetical protein
MELDTIPTWKPRILLGAGLGSFNYSERSHTPEQQMQGCTKPKSSTSKIDQINVGYRMFHTKYCHL